MHPPRPPARPTRRFTVVGIYPDTQQVAVFHRPDQLTSAPPVRFASIWKQHLRSGRIPPEQQWPWPRPASPPPSVWPNDHTGKIDEKVGRWYSSKYDRR